MGKKIPGKVLEFLVLEACEEGPTYGYKVVSRIEDITDGHWTPSYGTIYPLMQRLEDKGLIESLTDEKAEKQGLETGDRKYFAITDEGKSKLDEASNEKKEKFEGLIKGYLKVYEHVHGKSATENLLKEYRDEGEKGN